FSKIYGMAGLRVGFAAAKPEIISRLTALRMNVVSIVSARAVAAALKESGKLIPDRRATLAATRRDLCSWLRGQNLKFIEPHANSMMTDVGGTAGGFSAARPRGGVAPGRPSPPLDNFLRVTIGTSQEMAKFKEVFAKVYKG